MDSAEVRFSAFFFSDSSHQFMAQIDFWNAIRKYDQFANVTLDFFVSPYCHIYFA